MATPYQNVAKSALMNWNGLTEEEAAKKIQTESVDELEGQVYAMDSIKFAIVGIAKQINLSEEETIKFFEAAVRGPENDEIFQVVSQKMQGFTEEQKLGVLETIHDGWVVNNSSEKTFNKKMDRGQLRQYAPLELIGWNEVRSDLLFLSPVLSSVGVMVDEMDLSKAYHERVANYLKEKSISSQNDLTELVRQGRGYYPILPESLEAKLLPYSELVSSQLMQNWINKDPAVIQVMQSNIQLNNGNVRK